MARFGIGGGSWIARGGVSVGPGALVVELGQDHFQSLAVRVVQVASRKAATKES